MRAMKVLSISTMYPSRSQPVHALFVRERVRAVSRLCEVKVVCPVPWFPGLSATAQGRLRGSIPRYERQGEVDVYFPRFFSVPKTLKPLDGLSVFLSAYRLVKGELSGFDFDIIDAHLAYPDGFGAVLLGKVMRRPVTVTVRGHDLNDFPKYPARRRQIEYTLRNADRVIAVASALKEQALKLGAAPERVEVIPNGVDLSRFHPSDKASARAVLGLPQHKRIVLSVGHLVRRKGFQHIIEAAGLLRQRGMSDVYAVIVGGPGAEGDYSRTLEGLIRSKGLEGSVMLAGAREHNVLPLWYRSADLFCLASEKEGRPNVVLEAMACGLPVVATKVWGTPELLPSGEYGILVEGHDGPGMADAIESALSRQWDSSKITEFAKKWTWERNTENLIAEFTKLTACQPGR